MKFAGINHDEKLKFVFCRFPELPGSARISRRRESTPVMTKKATTDEKVFKRSTTVVQINPDSNQTLDVSATATTTTSELPKRFGVTKIIRDFEKFATQRSRHFNQSDSLVEETMTDSSQASASSPDKLKNKFLKNRRKISGTVPKNLSYLKQASVVDSPVYRRQRRTGIHVETSNFSEV